MIKKLFFSLLLGVIASISLVLVQNQQTNAAHVVPCVSINESTCIENVQQLKDYINGDNFNTQGWNLAEDTLEYWNDVLDQDPSTFSLGVFQAYYYSTSNPCIVLTASNGTPLIAPENLVNLRFTDTWYTSTICFGVNIAGQSTFMSINGTPLQTYQSTELYKLQMPNDFTTDQNFDWVFPLFITGLDTYPPGYDGDIIPNQPGQPPHIFLPDYIYTVDSTGIVRISYGNNSDFKLNGYGNYRITQYGENWTGEGEQLNQQVLRPFWQQTYIYDKLPEAGYYTFSITYEEGDWEVAPPGYDYVGQVIFKVYWDGKSFLNGANKNCEIGSPDYIQSCNNLTGENPFIKSLKGLNASTYGLQAVVVAPLEFISNLLFYKNSCTSLTLPIPYLSENLVIPCMTPIYKQHFAPLLAIYQNVLLALVSYYCFVRILGTIKDAQDPNINRIEVAKL